MLYRNKAVAVIGLCKSAPSEANYLSQIGCQVTYFGKDRPETLAEEIPFRPLGRLSIVGHETVSGLMMEDGLIPAQGVFILRETVAPNELFPQLETEGGYLKVDRMQQTNLPRLFAAGDCVGPPFQVAKAVGEGLVAGEMAAEQVEKTKS
jgi:thioredoxin reductase (NADPH)